MVNLSPKQGRTFASIIHSFLEKSVTLNETYLPLFNTENGRK